MTIESPVTESEERRIDHDPESLDEMADQAVHDPRHSAPAAFR